MVPLVPLVHLDLMLISLDQQDLLDQPGLVEQDLGDRQDPMAQAGRPESLDQQAKLVS